jgi:protein subunit release factor B
MIRITDQLSIPKDELKFTASRSRGPGGQHVNKASTRVTLGFDLINSPSLTSEQKQLVLDGLATSAKREFFGSSPKKLAARQPTKRWLWNASSNCCSKLSNKSPNGDQREYRKQQNRNALMKRKSGAS